MTIRVGDLKNQTGVPGPHPILVCRVCSQENSANAGDYFNMVEHHIFTHCGEEMELAMRRIVYDTVKP